MLSENILPAWIFAVVMSGTPGPANMILMATGAALGFRRALPFTCGVFIGFTVVLAVAGFGITALLDGFPALGPVITVGSSCYLLYLAWKIARIDLKKSSGEAAAKSVGLINGLIVHPMNPKAWLMATTVFAQFSDHSRPAWEQWLVMSVIFLFGGFPTNCIWTWGGDRLISSIQSPGRRFAVNLFLAISTVAIVAYMAFNQFVVV
ncbi:LysE family translocator [Kiloniella laminariae]|uniref:LysE family translocator n=1 Tax=Kiloniella laminariae TaxID=454162 RepID=UPI0003617D57|nr:LysE family translocator [Kiloniella laminariae]